MPKPKTFEKIVNFRLTEQSFEALEQLASDNEKHVATLVREIVCERLASK